MLEGIFGRAFLDLVFIMLFAFIASDVMMLPWLNPVGKQESSKVKLQGSLIFELEWVPGPIDVDSWVRAPGQPSVGYSNKGEGGCNLLRDDLGLTNDPLEGNFEQIQCRGLTPGEWVFNAHYYHGSHEGVRLRWVVRHFDGKELLDILSGAETLLSQAHELTMVRFHLDADGDLIHGSDHNGMMSIRSAAP